MECVLILLVYVVVFLGLFIFYGVPWLWENIIEPLLLLLLRDAVPGCWRRAKKLVDGILKGIACCSLMACGGVQALRQQIMWPWMVFLVEALKAMWRELYYWTVGDAED